MALATLRVLMIDDDEDDFVIVREMLRGGSVPFELDWTCSFAEGLAGIQRDAHDAYLIDYRLGVDSGVELLRAARAFGSLKPAILLTGRSTPEIDRAALEAGAADYLVKGEFDGERLSRALRYAVDHARARAELAESEARHRELFHRLPTPMWVYDRRTLRFLEVNDAAVDAYGYTREQFLSMSILEIRPEE